MTDPPAAPSSKKGFNPAAWIKAHAGLTAAAAGVVAFALYKRAQSSSAGAATTTNTSVPTADTTATDEYNQLFDALQAALEGGMTGQPTGSTGSTTAPGGGSPLQPTQSTTTSNTSPPAASSSAPQIIEGGSGYSVGAVSAALANLGYQPGQVQSSAIPLAVPQGGAVSVTQGAVGPDITVTSGESPTPPGNAVAAYLQSLYNARTGKK